LNPRELLLERQKPALRLGRERLPHRPFLRLDGRALLRGAQRSLELFGLLGGRRGCDLRYRQGRQSLGLQPLEFIPQLSGRIGGRLRRLEQTGPEGAIAEGAVEPDGKLPSDLEARQRRRVVAPVLMDRLVASAAQVMEEIDHVPRVGRIAPKATEQVGLRFVHRHEHAGTGSDLLCEKLAELPQLHQAGDGVVGEVALGQGGNADQGVVVRGEEAEVDRLRGPRCVQGSVVVIPAPSLHASPTDSTLADYVGRKEMPRE